MQTLFEKTVSLTYQQKMEREFITRTDEHYGRRQKVTGREAVLKFLLEHPDKIWWWSWEFVGKVTKDNDYLSHRAPARASDLAIHESELVEHRKVGRFSVYRLRLENIEKIKERLNI